MSTFVTMAVITIAAYWLLRAVWVVAGSLISLLVVLVSGPQTFTGKLCGAAVAAGLVLGIMRAAQWAFPAQ